MSKIIKITFPLLSYVLLLILLVSSQGYASVTVTAQVTEVVDAATGPPAVQGKKVVTIKYSEIADPTPTLDDFTIDGFVKVTDAVASASDTLSVSFSGSGDTYTLTFLGPVDGSESPLIPALKLPGYEMNNTLEGESADVATAPTTEFMLELNTLAGKGYAIIANYTNEDNSPNDPMNLAKDPAEFPKLPVLFAPDVIVRSAWSKHSDEQMPNLRKLYKEHPGGTINLKLQDSSGARFGDNRDVMINEIMWAIDESLVGTGNETCEQWIEIWNTRTTPIALDSIRLSTSKEHPAPDEETDRVSNIPDYITVWDVLGQDGNSSPNNLKEFISMYRTKKADGSDPENWNISTDLYYANYRGTPGTGNISKGIIKPRSAPDTDTPEKSTFVINEISNMSDDTLDWIEIKNIHTSAQSLNKWALSKVTAFNNESEIYRFPDISIPSGGILLLVNKHPDNTPLSRGFDLSVDNRYDQDFGADSNISYLIVPDEKLVIPNDNDWLLILRNGNPWNVKDSRNVYNSGHRLQDVAGPAQIEVKDINVELPRKEKKDDGAIGGDIWETTLFPMNGRGEDVDEILRHDRDLSSNVWARDTEKHGWQRHAFNQVDFTGIGYDRNVSSEPKYGGTPGYDNDVIKGKASDVTDGTLIISELMLTSDSGRYPQWIELHNTSRTNGIDLSADGSDIDGSNKDDGWRMIIENHNSGSWQEDNRKLHVTINLKDFDEIRHIPPNQTILITSHKATKVSDRNHFSDHRVGSVWDTQALRNFFDMKNRKSLILNAENGFYIKIVDGAGNVTDEVGNLDGQAADFRRDVGLDDAYSWHWPTEKTEDGRRTSLIRIMDGTWGADSVRGILGVSAGTAGTPRRAVPDRSVDGDMTGAVVPMGMNNRNKSYAWVHAVDTAFVGAQDTYYGNIDDISTPLHTSGTPLPVSLSFFRPSLEDGIVVIRWSTESELDNAGFNILRSERRDGEFKQVNHKLVQGQGTTAERNHYKWVDTAAKKGVVYYYQIEDVSFEGERTTLATTKLKGMVSAKNKLPILWSELKSQD